MPTMPDVLRTLAVLSLAGLTMAGGNKPATTDQAANAQGFVPPPVQPPAALPGLGNPVPLTAYIGKTPREAVGGVSFFDRTEVANALRDAVGDANLRKLMAGTTTDRPIKGVEGRIIASGCEAKGCGMGNWAFVLRNGGVSAEACHHLPSMGDRSQWYAGGAPVARPGNCPLS